jgi:hypothetical protein
MFSDALNHLGVQDRVARAVLGFVGDVFMDPLTYFGGPGNVVRWSFRGAKATVPLTMSVAKNQAKLIKQVARKAEQDFLRFGEFRPTSPLEHQLAPLFEVDNLAGALDRRTLQLLDAVHDTAAGANRLPRIVAALEAAKKELDAGTLTVQEFRKTAGDMREALIREIGFFGTTAQLAAGTTPQLLRKIKAAQDVARDIVPKSSLQLTVPGVAFLANRFPTAFGGWSGSIPLFRVGPTGRFSRRLSESHDAFRSRLIKEAEMTGTAAQSAIHDMIGGYSVAPLVDTVEGQHTLARLGVKLPPEDRPRNQVGPPTKVWMEPITPSTPLPPGLAPRLGPYMEPHPSHPLAQRVALAAVRPEERRAMLNAGWRLTDDTIDLNGLQDLERSVDEWQRVDLIERMEAMQVRKGDVEGRLKAAEAELKALEQPSELPLLTGDLTGHLTNPRGIAEVRKRVAELSLERAELAYEYDQLAIPGVEDILTSVDNQLGSATRGEALSSMEGLSRWVRRLVIDRGSKEGRRLERVLAEARKAYELRNDNMRPLDVVLHSLIKKLRRIDPTGVGLGAAESGAKAERAMKQLIDHLEGQIRTLGNASESATEVQMGFPPGGSLVEGGHDTAGYINQLKDIVRAIGEATRTRVETEAAAKAGPKTPTQFIPISVRLQELPPGQERLFRYAVSQIAGRDLRATVDALGNTTYRTVGTGISAKAAAKKWHMPEKEAEAILDRLGTEGVDSLSQLPEIVQQDVLAQIKQARRLLESIPGDDFDEFLQGMAKERQRAGRSQGAPVGFMDIVGTKEDALKVIDDLLAQMPDLMRPKAAKAPEELTGVVGGAEDIGLQVPMPPIPPGMERTSQMFTRMEGPAQGEKVQITFANPADQMIYEASLPGRVKGIEKRRAATARRWVMRAYGVSASQASKASETMRRNIDRQISTGEYIGLDEDGIVQIMKVLGADIQSSPEDLERLRGDILAAAVDLYNRSHTKMPEEMELLAVTPLQRAVLAVSRKTAGAAKGGPGPGREAVDAAGRPLVNARTLIVAETPLTTERIQMKIKPKEQVIKPTTPLRPVGLRKAAIGLHLVYGKTPQAIKALVDQLPDKVKPTIKVATRGRTVEDVTRETQFIEALAVTREQVMEQLKFAPEDIKDMLETAQEDLIAELTAAAAMGDRRAEALLKNPEALVAKDDWLTDLQKELEEAERVVDEIIKRRVALSLVPETQEAHIAAEKARIAELEALSPLGVLKKWLAEPPVYRSRKTGQLVEHKVQMRNLGSLMAAVGGQTSPVVERAAGVRVFNRHTRAAIRKVARMLRNSERDLFEAQQRLGAARQIREDAIQVAATRRAMWDKHTSALAKLEAEAKALEESLPHKTVQRIINAQRGLSQLTRVGLKGTKTAEPVQILRRQHELYAPYISRALGGLWLEDLTRLNKELGETFRTDDLHAAITWNMVAYSESRAVHKTSGLHPDDVLNQIVREMRQDPDRARLIDHPTVVAAAKMMMDFYEDFRLKAIARGIMAPDFDNEWAYLPLMFTDAAEVAARNHAAELGITAAPVGGEGKRARITQRFLMPRTTNKLRIQARDRSTKALLDELGPDGSLQPKYVTVWKGQLMPGGYPSDQSKWHVRLGDTKNDFEFARRAHLEEHPELMQSGDYWDFGWRDGRAEEYGKRWMPEEYMTSPQQLNNERGIYERMVGAGMNGPVFETDPVIAFAKRIDQQIFSSATDTFVRTMRQQILTMPDEQYKLYPPGALDTRIINGVEYRQLRSDIIRDSKVRLPIENVPEGHLQLWPDAVASELENFARTYATDKSVAGIFKATDFITSLWKGSQLYSLRWTTVNVIGSFFLAGLAGASPMAVAKNFVQSWRDTRKVHGLFTKGRVGFGQVSEDATKLTTELRKEIAMSGGLIEVGGETITHADYMKQALLHGVVNGGRVWQEVLTPIAANVGPEARMLAQMLHGRHWFLSKLGWWFKFNSAIEDAMRLATWKTLRDDGHSIGEATRLVLRHMFDYGDISYGERRGFVRAWPFYRWIRNNIALQMKMLASRPQYAAAFPKVFHMLQEAAEDENSLPMGMQPRWLRDQLAIGMWNTKDSAVFLNLQTLTPAQELMQMGQSILGVEGFSNFLRYFTSSSHPIVKSAFEIAAGREIYSQQEIGEPGTGATLSMPDYLWRQTGMINELTNKILPHFGVGRGGKEADPMAGVIRAIIGGRLQSREYESLIRTKRFEAGETATNLRISIKRALEKGEVEDAKRLSLRYIEMHRQLWDIGMVDMVPRPLRALFIRQGPHLPSVLTATPPSNANPTAE